MGDVAHLPPSLALEGCRPVTAVGPPVRTVCPAPQTGQPVPSGVLRGDRRRWIRTAPGLRPHCPRTVPRQDPAPEPPLSAIARA